MMEQGFPSDLFLAKDNVYAALVDDVSRNEMITDDVVRTVRSGRGARCLLTGQTEHLQFFAASRLASVARQVFVLKGGHGQEAAPGNRGWFSIRAGGESRVILATGSYIGEGLTTHD
jgi:hypothetical protein